ncbi:MAG: DUF167 domain-containing protein [Acidimicrobiia bacterium]|nr:DUF167 domain-containing protein [Acidimicrobiia bacterium]
MSSGRAIGHGSEGTFITIWVVARSKRPGLDGFHDGSLRVRVAAPPADGMANREVAKILRGALGVAPVLLSGATSRRKVFALSGLSVAEARQRLDLAVR